MSNGLMLLLWLGTTIICIVTILRIRAKLSAPLRALEPAIDLLYAYEDGRAYSDRQIALVREAIEEIAKNKTEDFMSKFERGEIELPEEVKKIFDNKFISLRQQLEQVTSNNNQLKAQAEDYKAKAETMSAELINKIGALTDLESKFVNLQADYENVRALAGTGGEQPSGDIAEMSKRIDDLQKERDELFAQLKQTEASMYEGLDKIRSFEEQAKVVDSENTAIAELQERLNNCMALLETKDNEIAELTEANLQQKSNLNSEIAAEYEKLKQENAQLLEQLANQRPIEGTAIEGVSLEELQKELADAKAYSSAANQELYDLKKSFDKLQKDNHDLVVQVEMSALNTKKAVEAQKKDFEVISVFLRRAIKGGMREIGFGPNKAYLRWLEGGDLPTLSETQPKV